MNNLSYIKSSYIGQEDAIIPKISKLSKETDNLQKKKKNTINKQTCEMFNLFA